MAVSRPQLILIFGLPGTGKSTLAGILAETLHIKSLNTDVIRQQLGKTGQYGERDKEEVYSKLLNLTAAQLAKGKSVIVDGTFHKKSHRTAFRSLAKKHHARIRWIEASAPEAVIKDRVAGKRPFTEADYSVYKIIKKEFEPMESPFLSVDTSEAEPDCIVADILEYLKK